jgi:hypothetical protein
MYLVVGATARLVWAVRFVDCCVRRANRHGRSCDTLLMPIASPT